MLCYLAASWEFPKEYKFAKTDEEKDKCLHKIRRSPNGEFTNGVFTMMASMLKVIKNQKPSHMVVAWDLLRNLLLEKNYFLSIKAIERIFVRNLEVNFL